jgi:hypothetical protein
MSKIALSTVLLALLALSGSVRASLVVDDDFEVNEGGYTAAPVSPSGTTIGFTTTGSTADRVTTTPAVSGTGTQRIFINDDPAIDNTSATLGGEWTFRHLQRGGTAANNTNIGSTGYIGYWVKTNTAGLEAALIIDEASSGTTPNERTSWKAVAPDGEWHLVEWNLDATVANTDWFNFNAGNGLPDNAAGWTSIDALLFRRTTADAAGAGDYDVEYWIDNVSHTTTAGEHIPVPEPASLGVLAMGGLLALSRRRRAA